MDATERGARDNVTPDHLRLSAGLTDRGDDQSGRLSVERQAVLITFMACPFLGALAATNVE